MNEHNQFIIVWIVIGLGVFSIAMCMGFLSRGSKIKTLKKFFELKERFDGFQSETQVSIGEIVAAISCASELEPFFQDIIKKGIENYQTGRTKEILIFIFENGFLAKAIEYHASLVATEEYHQALKKNIAFEKYREVYEHLLHPKVYDFLYQNYHHPYERV